MNQTIREILITSKCDPLTFDETEIADALRTLDSDERFTLPPGELSIVFLTDDQIGELHGTFLGDPTPTDVITFPGDAAFEEVGEICVGVERALEMLPRQKTSLSQEILLYLAHGWLHLAGYDDINEDDRARMREAEKEALALILSERSPPRFSLAD